MSIETIIPPQIINDELADWLTKLAARPDVNTVLEIGSSDGSGSTAAIVKGLLSKASPDWRMLCLEVSKPRFESLVKRYELLQPKMRFYNMASVIRDHAMRQSEIRRFLMEHPNLNISKYPGDTVVGWFYEESNYIIDNKIEEGGIERIKQENAVDKFDLCVLDGSAFCGMAELHQVWGAKIIVLDDTEDIKHAHSVDMLKNREGYSLIAGNPKLRNGFEIWERTT